MTGPIIETIEREQLCQMAMAAFVLGQRWTLEEARMIQEAEEAAAEAKEQAELLGHELPEEPEELTEEEHARREEAMVAYIRSIANLDRSPIESASDLRQEELAKGTSEQEIAALEAGRHRLQKGMRLVAPYLLEVLEVGAGPAGN